MGSRNQPSGNVTKRNPLVNTYFGDVDGDGFDEIIQFSKNRIFAIRNNFQRHGVLHAYLRSNIKRLVLGDFTTSGRESGRVQVGCIMEDGGFQVYSSSNDNRTLWWWFTQSNFIADDEEALVGDFTGDGADDILVYNPGRGSLKLHVRSPTSTVFEPALNFELGNLSDFDLRNKWIYIGDFGQQQKRADLLIVDPRNGQVSRYDSVTDDGNVTFWWAFNTSRGFVRSNDTINVGNLDGGRRDGILVASGTDYKFYKAKFDDGELERINTIAPGNLIDYPGMIPIVGHFAAFEGEPGRRRDDLILYDAPNRGFIQMDARHDPGANQPTYWWAYTRGAPRYHEGWPDRQKDKWLVVRCRLNDSPETEPENLQYYNDLFTRSGSGKWGMYNYLHNLSYGAVELDTEMPDSWATTTEGAENAKGNGYEFWLRNPFAERDRILYEWELQSQGGGWYYLWHPHTEKYLSSNGSNNGDRFWKWAPIPPGHDAFYRFKISSVGRNMYQFKHEHSGKYLCSGDTGDKGGIWMWGPIPAGHEARYTFKLARSSPGKRTIQHQYSQNFLGKWKDGMRAALTRWCAIAHDRPDLSDYKGIVSIYNVDRTGPAANGVALDGSSQGNIVNLLMNYRFDQNLVAHEMMHVYGLLHSFDDAEVVYQDPFDVEGSEPRTTGRFAGDFGSSGPGIHAVNKERLGWLPEQRIKTLPVGFTSPSQVWVAALERPECRGALSLLIELPNDEKLAIELREDRDWDQGFGVTAVYVRKFGKHPNPDDASRVTYLQKQGDGPQFLAGEEFSGFGITVKVLEIDAGNGTAKVEVSR